MRRLLASACGLLLVLPAGLALAATTEGEPEPDPAPTATVVPAAAPNIGKYLLPQIARHRKETWRWQRLMRKNRTPASRAAERSNDPDFRRWTRDLWKRRAATARRQAHNPPRKRHWLCIKRHEGPWNDPHPPYYGGLQMDLTFQRIYGSELLKTKGTADRWTPIEQIWVAERAFRSGRGFRPWPNTARRCGLLRYAE
jgi:hypothetical protein